HRCLLGLGRAEEIAAILQEFRLNESPSRGIAANLHHFRPFCFKPKRNGGNSCNFAGFPFWNSRPYRIAVFLQDFAYRIGVPGKIVEFADLACRMGVSREWCSFQDGGNIHFPTPNFFLNSLVNAGFFDICAAIYENPAKAHESLRILVSNH
ncbi:MAG: hypothetical protein E6230_28630, partial [Paenibacillus dendritiformis]|nr:hypothetical protein [Paenibacillus dendritiformis]